MPWKRVVSTVAPSTKRVAKNLIAYQIFSAGGGGR